MTEQSDTVREKKETTEETEHKVESPGGATREGDAGGGERSGRSSGSSGR